MSRKVEAINIYALYAKGSANGWNEVLTDCHAKQDAQRLARLRYALQAGMDDLVKRQMNDDKMTQFFLRLQKSLEDTMKKILRARYPTPLDNSLNTNNPELGNARWKAVKKKRDEEFELFLRKSAY